MEHTHVNVPGEEETEKKHLYNLDDFCDNKRICFKLM